jgi:eukaryotic-like serine/threonine-protein kinase
LSPRPDIGLVLKRLLRIALMLVIFAFSALTVIYFTLKGRTVEVPNVKGKSESDAQAALDDFGLRMGIKNYQQDKNYPINSVIDQDPAAGTTVKSGQLVRVSINGRPVPVPAGN